MDGSLGLDAQALQAFQLIPYVKSNTQFETPIYTTSFSVFINKDKWAEISPEDQEAIRAISQDKVGMVATGLWDSVSADVYSRFDELGISVVEADPALEATLVEAAGPITQAWKDKAMSAGIDADAALTFYRDRVKELSK